MRYLLTGPLKGRTMPIGAFQFIDGVCTLPDDDKSAALHTAMRTLPMRYHAVILDPAYDAPVSTISPSAQRLNELVSLPINEVRAAAASYVRKGTATMSKAACIDAIMHKEFPGWSEEAPELDDNVPGDVQAVGVGGVVTAKAAAK